MSDCCSPKGYRWMFSERSARSDAGRYRRKGVDATSRSIVEMLKAAGIGGRTVLEVGGGIGAVQLELLKAGAARTVSVELTPTYEEVAGDLIREAGVTDRVERRVMDFAENAGEVGPNDVVVMNRVVCCYPDMPKLVGAASMSAREMLVMSYPRRTWWSTLIVRAGNLVLRLTGREFQVFLHRPESILATSRQHGLEPFAARDGIFWTVAGLRRAAPYSPVASPRASDPG